MKRLRGLRKPMHWLGIMGIAALLSLGAAACGSDDNDANDSGNPPDNESATRMVETMHGMVEVPTNPQRIVLLNYDFTGAEVLALLEVPVLAVDNLPTIRPEIQLTGELIVVGPSADLDLEKIASLNPDLITGMYRNNYADSIERLRMIAPVALLDGEAALEWREVTTGFGKILNREEEVATLIADTEKKFEELAGDIDTSQTVAVVRPNNDGTFRVYADESFPGLVLAELGIKIPEQFATVRSTEGTAGARGWTTLSAEAIGELDVADRVIFWVYSTNPDEVMNQFLANPLWQLLDVAKEGRFSIGGRGWYGAGPISVSTALDDVEAAFNPDDSTQ